MNSIILVRELIDRKNKNELEDYLKSVWNQVWNGGSEINYANLRLLKVADKIKNISKMGVSFASKSVLDIGCGNGVALVYLRKYFDIEGVGVDISDSIIYELRKNVEDSKLTFHEGDHRDLSSFKANKFDIVLSFGVIEHFDEYGLALSEARRVLKRNGLLILIQPHLLSFGVVQEYYLKLRRKWKFGKQKDFSLFRYRSILKQAGFKDICYMTKEPYRDIGVVRVFDKYLKYILPFWGHYLYLIARK